MGKLLHSKTRKELIATLKPKELQFLRVDNGDLPEGYIPTPRLPLVKTAAVGISQFSAEEGQVGVL
jgi:hypothetical protein